MLDFLRHALRDTNRSIGLKWQSFVHYIGVPVLAVLLLWWLVGKEKAMDEVLILVSSVAGMCLMYVFTLLWNLWQAPYRITKDRIDNIESRLNSRGNIVGKASLKLPPPFDVKNWEGISPLQLGDAACLWVGVSPSDPLPGGKAEAKFAELRAAMMKGEISYTPGGFFSLGDALKGIKPWPKHSQPVSTVSLRRYADQMGDVPPFLRSVAVPQELDEVDRESGQ